ncbi:unnamed protein product [Ostreobium quekettii]|uniref:Uncharacterized protein n=1 Tax=Ostreobium quekettii TaxID=121088 RepID=A0A8S1JFA9_9CHLO|nr:unnamed protein product [Ostreobium quekettii]
MVLATSSQAAVLALRDMQNQLAAAFADINKLKDEKEVVEREASKFTDTLQEELRGKEELMQGLRREISSMKEMLGDLKTALEGTLEENSRLKEAGQLAEVAASKYQSEATALQLKFESCTKAMEDNRADGLQLSHELSLARQNQAQLQEELKKESRISSELSQQLNACRNAKREVESDLRDAHEAVSKLVRHTRTWDTNCSTRRPTLTSST